MKFTDRGHTKIIDFEEGDTDTDMRILEQGLALLRNIIKGLQENRK